MEKRKPEQRQAAVLVAAAQFDDQAQIALDHDGEGLGIALTGQGAVVLFFIGGQQFGATEAVQVELRDIDRIDRWTDVVFLIRAPVEREGQSVVGQQVVGDQGVHGGASVFVRSFTLMTRGDRLLPGILDRAFCGVGHGIAIPKAGAAVFQFTPVVRGFLDLCSRSAPNVQVGSRVDPSPARRSRTSLPMVWVREEDNWSPVEIHRAGLVLPFGRGLWCDWGS